MARIDLAWELGGRTGHVSQLLALGRALAARGHKVRMYLRERDAGLDLPGARDIEREGAPVWVGPLHYLHPVNFGQMLLNFGYAAPAQLARLVAAWRERLAGTDLLVAHVAPSALVAARTLGIAALEASQGFHVPPPVFPSPALREWEPPPDAEMAAADGRALEAVNAALKEHACAPLATLGDLYAGRALLLTYPDLDNYARGADPGYFGILPTGEEGSVPGWPPGRGPRVLAYLYGDCAGLAPLLDSLAARSVRALVFCRGISAESRARYAATALRFAHAPLAVAALLPHCDAVVCHASHQTTAQALVAGRPLLMLPTQVEQMLIARRVQRLGAGTVLAPDATTASGCAAALAALFDDPAPAGRAREFAARHASMSGEATLAALVARCEAALR